MLASCLGRFSSCGRSTGAVPGYAADDPANRLGKVRLPRISWAVERFLDPRAAAALARRESSQARQALAQYIARPPISLSKMLLEEHHSSVLYRSEYTPYFKTNARLFPAREFLIQHLPGPRTHLIRRYGLYSL